MLWETIVAPTLEHLAQGLRVPADGIKVALRYHHRPYQTREELRVNLDDPGTPEETDFYLLGPDIDTILTQHETPHPLHHARARHGRRQRANRRRRAASLPDHARTRLAPGSMTEPLIAVEDVVKTYGARTALDGASFRGAAAAS